MALKAWYPAPAGKKKYYNIPGVMVADVVNDIWQVMTQVYVPVLMTNIPDVPRSVMVGKRVALLVKTVPLTYQDWGELWDVEAV